MDNTNRENELINIMTELETKAKEEYCDSTGILEILRECLDDEDKKEYNKAYEECYGIPNFLYIYDYEDKESEETNE